MSVFTLFISVQLLLTIKKTWHSYQILFENVTDSANEICVCTIFGHAYAQKVASELLDLPSNPNFPLVKLLSIANDGPNVKQIN